MNARDLSRRLGMSCVPGALVTLNVGGAREPVFCIHPSGGQVTAYLRFRSLLGDDQPLFAIQSRALADPPREHPTLERMAVDYATLVQSVSADAHCQLLGWSLGGVIAFATAAELERRGTPVRTVGMIDAPRGSEAPTASDETAFAASAAIAESGGAAVAADVIAAALPALAPDGVTAAVLLARCEEGGLILPGALTVDAFESRLQLYRRHFALLTAHRPPVLETTPVRQWWAKPPSAPFDWSSRARGGLYERVLGGTHFSIMHPPHVEVIAADLRAGHRALAGTAARRSPPRTSSPASGSAGAEPRTR